MIGAIVGLTPGILIILGMMWFSLTLSYPEGWTVRSVIKDMWPKPIVTVYARKMESTYYFCHDIKQLIYK